MEDIVFGSPQWLIPGAVILVVGALVLLWSLWKSSGGGIAVWFSGLLKLVALGSIVAFLVEPMLRSERPQPGANLLAVAVDCSRSMEIHAPGETRSYVTKLKPALSDDASWQVRAAQDFAIRRYVFDARLRTVETFKDLAFDGKSSSIGDTVQTISSRFANRPTAGLLLFTDGMSTDSLPDASRLDGEMPIYPIVDHARSDMKDLSIIDPTVSETDFEMAPIRIEATLESIGFDGGKIVARLLNEANETVESQTFDIDSSRWRKRVRFQYKPKELGIQFVRLRVMLASEDKADTPAPESRLESTVANNTRLLAIDRGGGPYKVLYVSGRPNWEFKFIRRALEEDDELDCSAIIRMAKKEAKFNFRDRQVESTNPLFAGFDNAAEEATEQYDEPILVKIGADAELIKAGFPKSEESLFPFHAIILDDVEAKFFTQAQMLLMRQFVAERGGGLMMLGGQESFDRGGYRDTAIGDLLPVYMRNGAAKERPDQTTSYRLTREGGLEPWARLRASETDEAKRIASMPPFQTWNPVAGAKPGATVIATLGTETDKTHLGLVTQPFGAGRTAALMVGDMWRWGMRREQEKNDDLAQSWRQVARWLTANCPKRLEVIVEPAASETEPVKLSIICRDEKYLALDNAVVTIEVLQPDGKLVPVSVTPDRKRPGYYIANYWSSQDGPYVASVTATASDGSPVGEREVGWAAEPSAAEFRTLVPDLTPLREIAERTGGEVIDIDDLDEFVTSLPTRKVSLTEQRIEPLWHRTSWLLLTIFCLCAEWGIRRVRGLP